MRSSFHNLRMNPRFLTFLFFLGSVYLAYMMGHWVLDYRPTSLGGHVAIFCGLGVLLAILGRWRFGVFLFLLALTFEDLVRKYLGNSMYVYFVKDIILLTVYGAFFFAVMKKRERLFRPSFRVPLLAFAALAAVQIFNPRTTSIFYGLLGMEIYLFYLPLIFIGYSLLSDLDDLEQFLSLNLKIACVVAAVGIVQASGHANFLNPVNLAPALRNLGHLVRIAPNLRHGLQAPPSVFVSQGRYGNYLELMLTLALGTAAFQLFRRRPSRWTYLSLALLGVAIFLSGAKGALVYTVITAAALGVFLLWGMRGHPWMSARLGKILRRGVIAMAGGFCLFVAFFPHLTNSWETYYYDMLWPSSSNSELGSRVANYPLSELEIALGYPHWVTGYGTGIASLGVEYVTEKLHAPDPPVPPVENGFGTLLIEMGILGPILWCIMSAAILISGWNVTRHLAWTPLYPVALSIVWFAFWVLLPFTWGSMNTYQNFVVNAYLWLLVGVLFRLPTFVSGAPPARSIAPAIAARPAEPVPAGQTP